MNSRQRRKKRRSEEREWWLRQERLNREHCFLMYMRGMPAKYLAVTGESEALAESFRWQYLLTIGKGYERL